MIIGTRRIDCCFSSRCRLVPIYKWWVWGGVCGRVGIAICSWAEAKRGNMGLSMVSLQAPLGVWTLGGLNTPSAPCEGEEAGTTARPALHTLVYYKSNIMWLPNGQIFAGSSIFTPGRSQDNCSEVSEVQDSLWQEFTPTRWFDESPNLHALDHSANLALIIWKL